MANLLLDTQVLIWAMTRPEKLGRRALADLRSPQSSVFVSPLSVLEVHIKQRRGKLRHVPIGTIYQALEENDMQELPFDIWAALKFGELPKLNWSDPFDAAIMAQAASKKLTLMTADENILGSGWSELKLIDATQ